MADEKAAALSNALAQIERQFGKGSIMKMGEIQERMAFDVISSGSIALDLALGVGGFPRGRIIEIYGPESSGKTTLALHVIAEAQKNGATLAYGRFITLLINFLIVAWVLFMVVKAINRMKRQPQPAPAVAPAPTREEVLLKEIRDLLAARK